MARTELNLYGLRISRGDVRGKVQAAYHAGQARGSDHGPR